MSDALLNESRAGSGTPVQRDMCVTAQATTSHLGKGFEGVAVGASVHLINLHRH
jgi:hypothetical protein